MTLDTTLYIIASILSSAQRIMFSIIAQVFSFILRPPSPFMKTTTGR